MDRAQGHPTGCGAAPRRCRCRLGLGAVLILLLRQPGSQHRPCQAQHGNAGLGERWSQGLRYVGDFALRDPAGFLILASCLVYLVAVRKDLKARAAAGGIVRSMCLYIVSIGGDFMSGRFFTAPVFLAVAETVRTVGERSRVPATAISGAGIAAVLLVAVHLLGFNGFSAEIISSNGIADERKFYATSTVPGRAPRRAKYPEGWVGP